MEITISHTIKSVPQKEWDTLLGTDYIQGSHGWYTTVEESNMRTMRYVFIKDKKLTAAAASYVYTEKMYHMKMPFLDVKSFHATTSEHTTALFHGLKEIQKKEGLKGLLILDLEKKKFDSLKTQVKGFSEFLMHDDTYIDLNFSDFEDYLASLSGKARRSVRITLNRAKRLQVHSLITNQFSQWKKTAHRLQGYFCEQYNDYRTHLPETFYEALEKYLKDKAELIMFFKEDIPLAFGMPLNSPTISQLNLGGVDPNYREYHAYFLIYYEAIKRALDRGQKRIYFGPSSYEFKERIGCKRKKFFGLFKLENPLLNMALRSYMTVQNVFKEGI